MEVEDRILISTPEGVEVGIVLAGAASRFIAAVIDLAIQLLLILLCALAIFILLGGALAIALFAMALFAALYLYDVLFEVLNSGRTPGKRLARLRVVRDGGQPVDLPASAIRNALRIIDFLPTTYLVGLLAILLSARNQRLGDIAAGTLVIRDPRPRAGAEAHAAAAAPAGQTRPALSGAAVDTQHVAPVPGTAPVRWDASTVSAQEMLAVHRFLARRHDLDRGARLALAYRLERGLREKVTGAPRFDDPERFLEELARAKEGR